MNWGSGGGRWNAGWNEIPDGMNPVILKKDLLVDNGSFNLHFSVGDTSDRRKEEFCIRNYALQSHYEGVIKWSKTGLAGFL